MSKEPGGIVCPAPVARYARVSLAHGGGGRLMRSLIRDLMQPSFDDPALREDHDGAVLDALPGRVAITTDSYVVSPLFFPGGDIGRLAVFGTVNDLLMCGARPVFLSIGLILEEGLPMETLEQMVRSAAAAAAECDVRLVTGDTKVVERGHGDGIYINTSGVGFVQHGREIMPRAIAPGDAVLLSGDVGRHGIAIMAAREGLAFETRIESDLASLCGPVLALLEAGVEVHCMRDLTRGGLGTALIELAGTAEVGMVVGETMIPVEEEVRGACEILGLDPLYVANEGRFVTVLPEDHVDRALAILREHSVSRHACRIGKVTGRGRAEVSLRGALGVERVLDMPSGEQLPRIC